MRSDAVLAERSARLKSAAARPHLSSPLGCSRETDSSPGPASPTQPVYPPHCHFPLLRGHISTGCAVAPPASCPAPFRKSCRQACLAVSSTPSETVVCQGTCGIPAWDESCLCQSPSLSFPVRGDTITNVCPRGQKCRGVCCRLSGGLLL